MKCRKIGEKYLKYKRNVANSGILKILEFLDTDATTLQFIVSSYEVHSKTYDPFKLFLCQILKNKTCETNVCNVQTLQINIQ